MKRSAASQILLVLILLCLTTPLTATAASAQDTVATVVAVRGTVVAKNASDVGRNLSIKSPIFQDDVLKTDANSQLQIMFTDSSIISLGRASEMKIAEYRWQAGQKDGALKTQVKEGTFRVMGGALAKDAPQNFKTETPTATIGIRGSMYAFTSTMDSLSVVFQGGKGIEVFNEFGKISITLPGFGTRVVLNTPPEKPHRFTEQELNNLNRQLNGNGGTSGGGTDNGGSPLASTDQTPKPPVPPVLPPTNELPSAPSFTLPPLPPSDGIYAYEGGLGGVSTGMPPYYTGYTDTFTNGMSMGVNWYNKRIFGVAYDNSSQKNNKVFFFGSVNGSTVTDITILGADTIGTTNEPSLISGSGVGVFAGAAYDFFAFAATGNTYSLVSLTPHDSWTVAGGGQQTPGAINPVAPKGQETWQAFTVGTSVDLTSPTSILAMYQSAPGDFSIFVDKDAGTISGNMNSTKIYGTGANTTGVAVGGNTSNSVYLRDDLMAALIHPGDATNLKDYGNFMVVTDPQNQFSSYFTWGYWEIAYTDSASNRLMAAPYSLWIAGNPTPSSVITNLATNNYIGVYNGKAIGAEISAGAVTNITGTSTLTADFNYREISGNINFPGIINLPIVSSSTDITSNHFTATITNSGNISGNVNGAFFGPAANAVAGNFSAANSATSKQYLGIFGGNLQSMTPAVR